MSKSCSLCGREYSRKSDLERHTWSHFEVTPYHCKYCGMYFSQASSLSRHLNTHDSSCPFECSKCGHFKIDTQALLEEHKKECPGKENKCDECPQTFSSKSGLWSHKNSKHSKTLRFQCNNCRRRPFLSFATYEAHRKKRHPELTSPQVQRVERSIPSAEEEETETCGWDQLVAGFMQVNSARSPLPGSPCFQAPFAGLPTFPLQNFGTMPMVLNGTPSVPMNIFPETPIAQFSALSNVNDAGADTNSMEPELTVQTPFDYSPQELQVGEELVDSSLDFDPLDLEIFHEPNEQFDCLVSEVSLGEQRNNEEDDDNLAPSLDLTGLERYE